MQIKPAPNLVNAKIVKIMDKTTVSEKIRISHPFQSSIIFFIH